MGEESEDRCFCGSCLGGLMPWLALSPVIAMHATDIYVTFAILGFLMSSSFRQATAIKMGLLIVDILRVSAQFWMFSMHAAAMLFMCCSQKDIIDAHQGRFAPLLHLVNQGQLAVEVFFILSGFLFYKSAISADLTQPPAASRCAHFVISRCLRLWPIMVFCSILLLPSPVVPNRAAAAWTLLFASNHLPWNQQFLSWLWSISVDVQYFVVAVVAVFMSKFASSRAPAFLAVMAISAALASLVLSIRTASQLISAPAASALLVPMPVIGIDWMKEGAMIPAVDAFYSSLYLSAARRCLPWVMGLAVAHFTRDGSRACLTPRSDATTGKQPRSLLFSLGIVAVALLLSPCMNTTTACSEFLSPGHATLFLALHRPAFSVFVVIILIQYGNQSWQRKIEATWPKACSMLGRLSDSSYAFMVLHPIIMGGAFTALDSVYGRQCPIFLASLASFACCLATVVAADVATRYIHKPIFNLCRNQLSLAITLPKSRQF